MKALARLQRDIHREGYHTGARLRLLQLTQVGARIEVFAVGACHTVCYTTGVMAVYYTMTVNRVKGPSRIGQPRIDTIYQTLWNYQEVRSRSKRTNQDWPAWTVKEYVFDADLEEVRRLAKKALKIAKAAL